MKPDVEAHATVDNGSRYAVRQARGAADVTAAQALRCRCFGAQTEDGFDDTSLHVLIEDRASGTLVCCYRLTLLDGSHIDQSYSGQYYELSALSRYEGRMLELGRFCIHPDWHDPDILRLAWAELTRLVDASEVRLLFGCSSFVGVEAGRYLDAFAVLKARHLAPARWLPRVKAPDVFRFAARLRRKPDLKKALAVMPPLLRTYLLMGGWVSDHAVVDRQMGTLHVFTGLEIGAIPAGRKRLLRALV